MIKRIQLRGISRTPSDRATADGGCAESLNVHLDQGETAPTMPPDMTEKAGEIYGQAEYKCKIVFIHKMLGVTNYIGVMTVSGVKQFLAYGSCLGTNHGGVIISLGADENLTHISSVGNTLIIFSDKKPHYFLFKENAYISLGSEIPRPRVEVITKHYTGSKTNEAYSKVAGTTLIGLYGSQYWNDARKPDSTWHEDLLATMDIVWDNITTFVGNWRQEGYFAAPFFIRYALKLYDGSYVYTSAPILCGAGKGPNWVRVLYTGWRNLGEHKVFDDDYDGYLLKIILQNIFQVHIKTDFHVLEWSDIVKSIDIFASTPIYTPAWYTGLHSCGLDDYFVFETMDNENRDRTVRDEVLSKGQFYKIKSIAIQDNDVMRKFRNGYLKIEASDDVSGENLATHEDMPDGYRDGNQYLPKEGTMNYNSRLLLMGGEEMLTRGDEFLNGLVAGMPVSSFSTRRYALRFKIVDPLTGKAHYVNEHYRNDGTMMYPGCIANTSNGLILQFGNVAGTGGTGTTPYQPSDPWSWIAYPDTRCKEVEVFFYDTSGNFVDSRVVPMEPHPLLECAFVFLGLDKSLLSLYANGTIYDQGAQAHLSADEDRMLPAWNKVFLSEFQNPFLFPAQGIITFPDKVVGAAGITVPLSEGQVGDFTVYVFTEGGIRVLIPTAEGTFAANLVHPNLSRHIAIPGSIMAMEQAVVFITRRGVMVLSGSNVTEISGSMNGMPYSLTEGGVSELLSTSDWSGLLDAATAGETLMQFMGSAQVAYDHNGQRLLFFNPSKAYQYVYMIETQTWHKVKTGVLDGTILNSYPECLVSFNADVTDSEKGRVYNFSTMLDDASLLAREPDSQTNLPQPVKGIIATRPIDLGEPDIRKAIRSIRIRGNYNRNNVKYILLGSFDGINWKRLTSLRGGSYKQFRLIILANLTATERITWVDVDYESRMTNKLR